MTPFEAYLLSKHKMDKNQKLVHSILLQSVTPLTEEQMFQIAKPMDIEGFQFIAFCRENNYVRSDRFSDKWQRQHPHSVAQPYPKQEPFDVYEAVDRQYTEVYK